VELLETGGACGVRSFPCFDKCREIPFAPPNLTWPKVALYRPILQWGCPSDEGLSVRRIGSNSFFVTKPRLGGLPKINDRLSQKPLATRTFIVQNSRVWS
jgi:hypothetical protein